MTNTPRHEVPRRPPASQGRAMWQAWPRPQPRPYLPPGCSYIWWGSSGTATITIHHGATSPLFGWHVIWENERIWKADLYGQPVDQ